MSEEIAGNDPGYNREYLVALKCRLCHMMKTGDYSDVTFLIEGEELHCHKNILAATCLFFDTMFKSELTGPSTRLIEIKTTPKDIFKAIVEFCYTGDIRVTSENAQEMLQAADMMQFELLKQICCKFFVQEMDPQNCCGIWQMASSVNARHLESESFTFAAEHFQEVMSPNEEFLHIDSDMVQSLLLYPHIKCASEDYIIERALDWLNVNPCHRLPAFSKLLHQLPMHMVSLMVIQYKLLKHESIRRDSELLMYLQDVVNHIVLFAPIPHAMHVSFPRTRLDYVEGLAVLSREAVRTGGARMKLSFYRFQNEDSLTVARSEDLPLDFMLNEELTMCGVDSSLYVCNSDGFHRYDMATKAWASLHKWSSASKHKILLTEGKRLFSLEYSHYKCPITEYNFLENSWSRIGNLKKKLMNQDFAVLEYRGAIFVFSGNNEVPDMIQVFDLATNSSYILDLKLPNTLTGLNCLQYKGHVIITGLEASYVYKLEDLHSSFLFIKNKMAAQEMESTSCQDQSNPTTKGLEKKREQVGGSRFRVRGLSGDEESGQNSLEVADTTCTTESSEDHSDTGSHRDVKVMVKAGTGRTNYSLERLGSEVIIMAGKSHHPKFCKEVQAIHIDQYLQEDSVEGWRTVAMLSSDLNRYNISVHKAVKMKFKQ